MGGINSIGDKIGMVCDTDLEVICTIALKTQAL